MIEAYRNRLVADLSDLLTSPGLQGLRLNELNINGRRGRADLRALFPDGPIALKANLALVDSSWKIAEVTIDGRRISAHYRRRYRDAIDAIDKSGCVQPPDGPGLGVTYDWDFIERHKTGVSVWE